jgi:predicted nucleic acid-binding protein
LVDRQRDINGLALIAGQAVRNKLTLITANVSEFARIKALVWADWGKP